jgi:hypothetical protein
MPQDRREMVRHAFNKFDKYQNDSADPEELIYGFDGKNHPEVVQGMKTPADVFREFLSSFDVSGGGNIIYYKDFESYYCNVSACVEHDEEFEQVICSSWGIPLSARAAAGNFPCYTA